jgi:hypothetical protein
VQTLPRILAIMGSGETTSSMAPVHRAILGRFGGLPVRATLLDTPYGFQENAADITAAAVDYFATRLRNPITVASFRGSGGEPVETQVALARIRDADYVFSGPGSPSYALRHWAGTEIPSLLARKLADGGALVAASAAALTLGRLTLPVYEIYKVGEEARWLPGLDVLSPFGLPVAVIPHYDNAEGRGHDTRFCFLGERRLRRLEAAMPDDTFILGIDEHTSFVLDLGVGRATIRGRGGLTVRRAGRSVVFGPGSEVSIDELRAAAFGPDAARGSTIPAADRDRDTPPGSHVSEAEEVFDDALARLDLASAIRSLLALGDRLSPPGPAGPSRNGAHTDGPPPLRPMLAQLANAAETVGQRAELVGPLTDALVEIRRRARSDHDWAAADAIRETLRAVGIELQDVDEATTWSLPKA